MDSEAAAGGYPRPILAWGVVAALFLAYIFSFIDRMIIGLLVEPIKADLTISDTQISLLQGLAFALFYTVAGIPIGRMVDRVMRMRMIAGGVALWSVATAICGWAGTFGQLFVARMGVGVGEAVLSPPAYSVIADSFPARRLGLAMGVYGLGAAVGAGAAFLLGAGVIGLVAHADTVMLPALGTFRVWQLAFLAVGLPGLLVALLFLALPEPARREPDGGTRAVQEVTPAKLVWAFARLRAGMLVTILGGASLINLGVQAGIAWFPAILMRGHSLDIVSAGTLAGTALIAGGVLGTVGGGWLADRMAGGTPAARLKLCVAVSPIGAAAGLLFPLLGNLVAVWLAFALFFAAASVTVGVVPTVLQQVIPNRMRGTVSSVYLFAISVIGIGMGPTAAALLADRIFVDPDGIRIAVAICVPIAYIAATLLYVSAQRRVRDGMIL